MRESIPRSAASQTSPDFMPGLRVNQAAFRAPLGHSWSALRIVS